MASVAAALITAAAVVCAEDKQTSSRLPVIKDSVAVINFPLIGFVETQQRIITIKAGSKGAIYSVKTSEGKVLCENASLEQLRAKAPDLHDFIKTAVAKSPKGGKLDASVRNAGIR